VSGPEGMERLGSFEEKYASFASSHDKFTYFFI
jgi:hypothetical protein